MRRILFLATCLVPLVFVPVGFSQVGAEKTPAKSRLGHKIDNFKLATLDGKFLALHDFKEKKAVVVVFITFDCPVSNSYLELLSAMAKSRPEVGFLGVCVSTDDAGQLARQAKEYPLGFPIVHDARHLAVEAFQARITPEVFVLDSNFVLRYRGRIDDTWAGRLKKNRDVTRHDLRDAVDAVLAGKDVPQPATEAIGCPIPLAAANPQDKVSTKLTYYKDVLPILQNRCQICHRPGEMGPFSLMTYHQAVCWADDIKEYTQSRKMPPWKPAEHVPFHGERKMTAEEIATLAAWVDGGTPEGNKKDAPPTAKFTDGWMLGKPDLVLTPSDDFVLGATGPDVFRCFVFPTDLPEDKFVAAYEVRPGSRRAVHHTLHFLDLNGRGRKLEEREQNKPRGDKDFGPGYNMRMHPGFIPDGDVGGWAPGITPHFFPDGVGYYLPKKSDIVVQIHYHRTGKVERDRTQIGLYFTKNPNGKPIQAMVVGAAFLTIPAGAENHVVKGSAWAGYDSTIYTVIPHMHLIGKKIKISMTPPNGPTTTLVKIEEWDYNWQEIYQLKEPIRVKENTRFDLEAVYDNTTKNPTNPFNPPRRITVGEGTNNEMCFGFLGAVRDEPGPVGVRLWPGGIVIPHIGVLPKENARRSDPDFLDIPNRTWERPAWRSLVPKLRLGTHTGQTLFGEPQPGRTPVETEFRWAAFPNGVWE